jgi:exonuclease III
MKKLILNAHVLLALTLLILSGGSQSIWAQQAFTAKYDFAEHTSAAYEDRTTPPTVAGIKFGSFKGSSALIANAGSGRFNFSNWPLDTLADPNVTGVYGIKGPLDTLKYFEVTVSPNPGSVYSLSSITFKVQRSATSIRTYVVRSSIDNFASNLPASTADTTIEIRDNNIFYLKADKSLTATDKSSVITLPADNFSSLTSSVTFRIYAWNAESSGGTFSIDNVEFAGTVTDKAAPTLSVFSPANGAINIPTSSALTIHFSEPVKKGTGSILIKNADGTVHQTIEVTSDAVTTAGDSATILPPSPLAIDSTLYIEVDSAAFTDLAGNAYAGFKGNETWSFTTMGTSLAFTGTPIDFGKVMLNQDSIISYNITPENLQSEVSITTAAPYSLSKDNTETSIFTTSINFTQEELASTKEVFVKFSPVDTTTASGMKQITHTTGSLIETVSLSGIGTDPYKENFNACSGTLSGFWTQYSVSGDQTWACTTFGRGSNAVQISGFSGSARDNKDWLISPAMDLSDFNYALLSFWSRTKFAGKSLELKISTDYDGVGNPEDAQFHWTTISGRFPEINSDIWTESKEIDITHFKAAKVHIAFVYTSDTLEAPRWTIDDFKVENSETAPAPYLYTNIGPLSNFNFGMIAPLDTSDSKNFKFSASSLTGNLIITATEDFLLSKDGVNFSTSLTYIPSKAFADSVVFVRFAPGTSTKAVNGSISFSSTGINASKGFLTGTTIPEEKTLDIVSWNVEWFGRTTPLDGSTSIPGPTDKAKQFENVKTLITTVNADIYALQEISSLTAFNELVLAIEPAGYKGIVSSAVSRADDPESQRTAYLYKTAVIDSISSGTYLEGAKEYITDAEYPTGNASQFWSSGRLPYMFEFKATIDGVEKTFNIINIHAKANESGSGAQMAYDRRVFDARVLKDSLDEYYPEANVIIIGDYNDDVDFTVANISSTRESSYKYLIDSTNFSAVTRRLSDAGLRSYITSDNVIDHITVSNELFDEHIVYSSKVVVPFDIISDYANTTSDHMPVATRFKFNITTAEKMSKTQAAKVSVYPNPTTSSINIVPGNDLKDKTITARLISIDGKQLMNVQNSLLNVNEEVNTALSNARAGIYVLQLTINDELSVIRISKQ